MGYFIRDRIYVDIYYFFFPQPVYNGPQKFEFLKPATLHSQVLSDRKSYWIIEFYATWSPPCTTLSSLFGEISQQYGTENLKFGKIDLGQYPLIAKKYAIDVNDTTSAQLPTLILFDNGEELVRMPYFDKSDKLVKCTFNKV